MEVDILDLGGKCVFFEEGFDVVIKEATEDLQDGQSLVSDLEIFPSFFHQSSVILPCSRHWTASERIRKLGKGCCITSLGFGRVVIFIDVVLVARHEGGHCRSGREMCLFRRRI